jgi:MoaA/NifB/PqqE/SkfB family radical SAM enzyme
MSENQPLEDQYGLRKGAVEFPMMIVLSIIYRCNFGCPYCPYTDGNSEIRRFYGDRDGILMPQKLWNKIADEAGEYGAWLRCTGGGEPMLHPNMTEMVEYAQEKGARVWMNTNGSMFGPYPKHRDNLERIIKAGIDLIEFSMDAGDAETYAKVRPPRSGKPRDPEKWWNDHLSNVRAALELRKKHKIGTRVVVSIIRQRAVEDKIDEYVDFWLNDVGVDDVITRKFLTWDDNTSMSFDPALDLHMYADSPTEAKLPCVWPFERLNVDSLGRIGLCGQDISFRTAEHFPNVNDTAIKEIWQGETFNWYRRMHLEGRGAEAWPCRGCSAWKAGIRDWDHGWLKVLETSGDQVKQVMAEDEGYEVEIFKYDYKDDHGK